MNTKFRRFISYLLVLMLICSNLSVPALAEEVIPPVNTLTLPAALQIIEEEAFYGNTSISRVVVPEGTTEIHARAFAESSLQEIVLSSTLTYIADSAFDACGEITVSAPEGCYAYEWAVKKGYIAPSAYTTEVLDDGTLAITGYTGTDADIVIPAEIGGVPVTKIAGDAFADNEVINHVTIPEGVTAIGYYAFNFSTLTGIDLPQSLTTLEHGAFCSATSLTEIEIPASVTVLPEQCFASCTSLTSAILPDTLTTIQSDAFFNCPALTELIIPASVTAIRASAFEECGALIKCYAGSFAHTWLMENAADCFLTYEVISSATPEDHFETETLGNGTLAITGYTGTDTDVVIPGSIGGVPVTEIGYGAFEDSSLTSVVIPEGVTFIESYAFSSCSELSRVTLPSTLETIDHYAFGWSAVSEINLPEGLTFIGDSAFLGAQFTTLHIPSSVTSIDEWTFRACSNLTAVMVAEGNTAYKAIDGVLITSDNALLLYPIGSDRTTYAIPEGVVEIKPFAFDSARLTSVGLPESLETINSNAFYECRSLQSIHIPANVARIDESSFNYCSGLQAITVAGDNAAYQAIDNVLLTKNGDTLLLCLSGEAEYTVPDSVIEIARSAFGCRYDLTHVTLPDGLKSIGDYAFDSCESLESINIPASCTYVGMGAFGDCGSLKEITLPEGVKRLDYAAFFNCTSLEKVVLPESLTRLESVVFYNCASLTSINLPEAITHIDESAFEQSPNVVATVSSGSYAHSWCLDHGVAFSFGYDVTPAADFEYDVINGEMIVITGYTGTASEIVVPDEIDGLPVRELADNAFAGNTALTKAVILHGVQVIGSGAFSGCSALTEVVLPETIFTLSGSAFAGCSALTEMNLPECLAEIDLSAFSGCGNLVVTVIAGSYAANFCEEHSIPLKYKKIHYDESNFRYYITEDDAIVITDFLSPSVSMNVPATIDGMQVVGIDSEAFSDRFLTDVTLPEGLTFISGDAFYNCSMSSISLPSTLRSIGAYAFAECDNLTGIVIPEGVETLGSGAFYDCTSLRSTVIPGSVERIPHSLFSDCTNLTDVTLCEGVAAITESAFNRCTALEQIDLPESLREIGSSAFRDCTSLTSLTIPAGVTEISGNPFRYCSSLTSLQVAADSESFAAENGMLYSKDMTRLIGCLPTAEGRVVVPDGVASLAPGAFASCSSLTAIVLPASVTSLDYFCFEACSATVYVHPDSYAADWCRNNNIPYAYLDSAEGDFTYSVLDDQTVAVTGYTGTNATAVIPSQLGGMNVTAIAADAFSGLTHLTGVVIPEGVTAIGDRAFANGPVHLTISLPGSLTSIGESVFLGVSSFAFTVHPGTYAEQWCIDNGFSYTQAGAERLNYSIDDDGNATITGYFGRDREFTIPATLYGHPVTALSNYAFSGNSYLTRVNLPAALVSIPARAFSSCYKLTDFSVDEANPVYSSRDGVIYSKDGSTLVRCPSGRSGEFTVPDGVAAIGDYAFEDINNLTQINLPEGLVSIGERALCNTGVTSLFLPDSVAELGDGAFSYSESLVSIRLSESLTTLSESAFIYCTELKEIVIPDSVTRIENYAFADCYRLENVTLGSGLTYIGNDAFFSCRMKSIVIPEGVTSIGSCAFAENSRLAQITLPETLTSIGTEAFYFTGLKSIRIPAAVTEIGRSAFGACDTLADITVAEANGTYRSMDGVLFTEDGSTLIAFPAAKTADYTVPAGTVVIGRAAFNNCYGLKSVVVPEGVKTIEFLAFASCDSLTSVSLPASVEFIDDDAFSDSSNAIITAPEGSYALEWATKNGYVVEDAVLESSHPYEDDIEQHWYYSHADEAYALAVTFSKKTEFEDGCDYLRIIDSTGASMTYTGSSLSGRTLILPGRSFTIELETDESVTEFGFRITEVKGLSEEEFLRDYLFDTTELEDGTLSIIGTNEPVAGDLVIPAEIQGKQVTAIGNYAFSTQSSLTSVSIPAGVTSIGNSAFYRCTSLTEVVIPDGVVGIGSHAFSSCTSLTEIVIPDGVVSIGNNAFSSCTSLTEIVVPEGVAFIGGNTFQNCTSLVSVSLPSTLRIIEYSAFYECTALTSVVIPEGVTSIGSYAFMFCRSLTEAVIPEGVTRLEAQLFYDCPNLTSVSLPASLEYIADNAFYNTSNLTITAPEGSYAWQWGIDRGYIEEPSVIESDHPYANSANQTWEYASDTPAYALALTFSAQTCFENGCDWLYITDSNGSEKSYSGYTLSGQTIVVPGNSFTLRLSTDGSVTDFGFRITSIKALTEEEYLNYGGFTTQTLEDGTLAVTGYTGFRTEIEIPAEIDGVKVTQISSCAFSNSTNLTSVIVPEGVTSIEFETFYGCDQLAEVTLPASLTAIGYCAFYGCSSLSSISIPDGVTSIGHSAFDGCHALTSIRLPDGLTSIEPSLFQSCPSLTEVYIPDGVSSIGRFAFSGCYPLNELVIPDSVTYIGEYAFQSCYMLSEIVIPGSVTEIAANAFRDCHGATVLTVEEGVQSIGYEAFYGCSSLKMVNLPASLTFIDDGAFNESFNFVITAPEDSYAWQWAVDRDLLYVEPIIESAHPYAPNAEQTWTHTAEDENVYAHLLTFNRYTFINNGDWLTVADSEGHSKDYWWDHLRSKTIAVKGNSFTLTLHSDDMDEDYGFAVTAITPVTEEEFLNYGEFTYNTLEDGTAAITGFTGFRPDLTIPSEIDGLPVTAVWYSAFYDNDHLESVIIPEGVTTIMNGAFQECNSLSSVQLPSTLTGIQISAFGTCSSLTSVNLPEGLTSIGSYAFSSCSSLTEIVFPSTLTQVSEYAFAWNYGLTELAIPGSLTEISRYTFYNCTGLKKITVEEGVQTIGEWAFGDIASLESAVLPASVSFIDDTAFANDTKIFITAPEGSHAYQWAADRNLLYVEPIIESAHPYAPNTEQTWTHTADSGDVYAHLVTFSRNTYFDSGDYLIIIDEEGNQLDCWWEALRGKTVALKGNSFTMTLYSDEWNEGHGFEVIAIVPLTEEEFLNYGEFTYNPLEDGTAAIAGFTGFRPDLTIPSEIDGLPVSAIADNAFYNADHLESVVISEGVTSIMNGAFQNCSSLSSVQLPSTLTGIHSSAFADCTNLETVALPASVSFIDDSAFSGCSRISLIAPEGSYAWQWAVDRNLLYEEAIIESAHPYAPNTEQTWSHTADGGDIYAHLITFSRHTSFYNGDRLRITDADGSATDYFWGDLAGRTIVAKGDSFTLTLYSDGMDESYGFAVTAIIPLTEEEFLNYGEFTYTPLEDGSIAVTGFTGFRPDLTIPSEINGLPVTAVWYSAFYNADHLESVVIPEGVTTVMGNAFQNCISLRSVQLPSTLTGIQGSAFNSCCSLTSVNLPEGLTSIGSYAFSSCGSLTELTLPSTLAQMGEYAFAWDYALTEITIPGSLTEIGLYAFYNCTGLKQITVEEGVQSIAEYAFGDIASLESAVLPASVSSIHDNAFINDTLLLITAPEGSRAYQWAADRDLLYVEPLIQSAHPYAPNSGETWSHTADSGDVYAHLITFSRQTFFSNGDWLRITDADGSATDYYWSDLPGRTICVKGDSFTLTLYSDGYDEAFGFAVTAIIPLTEEEFLNYGEFTYNTLEDGTAAVTGFTGFRPDLTIPSEIDGLPVTAIMYNAFYNADHLESVVIPEGVTTIMNGAFQECSSLSSVQLPSTLTSIESSAFSSCSVLTETVLPSTLTQMGEYAFAWNHGLTELTIPGSLTEISPSAFYSCSNLKQITVEEGVQSIGENAFANCSALESAVLPASVSSIHDNAFQNSSRVIVTAPEGSCAYNWAADQNLLHVEPILESAHPYAPNSDQTWSHTADSGDVYLHLITFSRSTYFGSGDWLRITDADGSATDYYGGDLTGRTIVAKGDSFTLTLYSDGYDEAFGFAVNAIVPLTEEEFLNYGEFTYEVLSDGTLGITGHTGFAPSLTIPAEIDGMPVSTIRYNAFFNNSYLETLVIADGVTTIEGWTFVQCGKLTEAYLPASLTAIGSDAFTNCDNLFITAPDGSFAHDWAAEKDLLVEDVIYESAHPYAPDTEQTWTYTSDRENTSRILVSFSRKTYFGEGDSLTIIDAEGNVREETYHSLMNRTLVMNGDSFTLTLRSNSYNESFGFIVTDIVPMTEEEYLNNGEFTYEEIGDGTILITGFTGCLSDLIIPAEIDGKPVSAIGSGAFDDVYALESVVIPEGVTSIGNSAFYFCPNLKRVELPDSLVKIYGHAFAANHQLKEINLPANLTSIEPYAFAWCSTLPEITIPERVTAIASRTFSECYGLMTVNLHAGLTLIDDEAFYAISKAYFYAPEGSYAYNWAADRNLLPETIIMEFDRPYAPDSEQTWTYNAQREDVCAILVSFSRRTNLSPGDFIYFTDEETASTPYYDSTLAGKTLVMKGGSFTLTLFSDGSDESYGFGVTRIEELTEEEFLNYGEFTYEPLPDGTLSVTGHTGYRSELVIPSQIGEIPVTVIGQSAFYSDDYLETIVLSDGITTISNAAFASVPLTSVSLPGTLTTIQSSAFNNCYRLPEIVIPEGVTTMDEYCLAYCHLLHSVSLPASLTFIADNAFYESSSVSITAPEGSYAYDWAQSRGLLAE